LRWRPGDAGRLHALMRWRAPPGKIRRHGDVLYHSGQMRPLQDVLAAIREHTTVDAAGLQARALYGPPSQIARGDGEAL
jgi:error-prone DNA polymerase